MPVVPQGTNLSAIGQSPMIEKPSPTNLLMAAADMAQRQRTMPGPGTAEPDLKAPRKKKMKVLR